MSVTPIIRAKMVEAMKAHNKEDRAVYAYLADQLEKARKAKQNANNPNPVLTDDEEISIIQMQIKQSKKAIEDATSKPPKDEKARETVEKFCADREREIAMYSDFLPKQMTSEEIQGEIDKILITLSKPINKGMLMKQLMPKVKGKADGRLVSELVDQALTVQK